MKPDLIENEIKIILERFYCDMAMLPIICFSHVGKKGTLTF